MKILITAFFACVSLLAEAQLLPVHNTFPELGLSFDIPNGWSAEQRGEIVVMGHQTIAGLIIMSTNEGQNAEQLRAEAQQGLVDEGVNLTAEGQFKISNGNKVSGFYTGLWEGEQVKCYAAGLTNELGKGVNVLVVTTAEKFTDHHVTEAEKLITSIKFSKPIISEQTVQWRNRLVPAKIEYLSSSYSSDYSGGSSGFSDNERITLCSNGYFDYYSNSQSSFSAGDGYGGEVGSGYTNGNGQGQGTYDFKTIGSITHLILSFQSGEVYEYALSKNEDGNTLLNGTRYFVVETEYCE